MRAVLKRMAQTPGTPKLAMDDVRAQLAHLVPPDLFASIGRAQLAQIPRYLKGISVRLSRIPHGPQKDQAKGAEIAPLFRAWCDRRDALRVRGVVSEEVESFGWMLEEARIAAFAPELKPAALPVARMVEEWTRLSAT